MATERQIAANRANAAKSTGPRSSVGKKRAAQNSISHGLAARYSGVQFGRELDQLARKILGDINDEFELELARTAAEAELDVTRVRRVKAALIERVSVTGGLVPPKHFRSSREETRYMRAMLRAIAGHEQEPPEPVLINPVNTMPSSEPQRSAEAARRVLPELIKLTRYECRAIGRRDRAIKAMMLRRSLANH